MQIIFGVLLMFTGAASGSLFQDAAVCRFNKSNQCYVALGQHLHLQIPWEDGFDLQTNTSFILKYRKTQSPPSTPRLPWQFVNDSKTMILTSAERNDSGTYTLTIYDGDGRSKGSSTLQVNIEAPVSSVKVLFSCLSPGVMEVNCSADGDNLHFNWTSDFDALPQLENGTRTVNVMKNNGNLTCHVKNNISHDHYTVKLDPCPEPTTPDGKPLDTTQSTGTISTVSLNETNICNQTFTTLPPSTNSVLKKLILPILGTTFVLLLIFSIVAIYIYKRTHGSKNKNAASQDGRELYTQAADTMERTSQAQADNVEYAVVVPRGKAKKQKSNEDEVHYGELVFNTNAKNSKPKPKVQEECVYSQVQRRS